MWWLCCYETTGLTLRVLKEIFHFLCSHCWILTSVQEAEYENDQALPSLGGQLFPSLGWLVPTLGGGASGGGQGEALQPAQLPLSTSHARLLEGCLCRLSGFHRGGGCFIKVFGLLHKENVMISPILHRCDWLLQNRMCPREIRKWIFLYASPERKLSAAVFTLVKMILPSSVCNKHLGFLKSKAHEK